MGNFTWDIKRELLSSPPENACCKIAACAAFLRTSGSITSSSDGLGLEIVSENDRIAEYFISQIEQIYGVRMVLKEAVPDPKTSKDRLTFSYKGDRAPQILQDTGIIRIEDGGFSINYGLSSYLVENECCALAYIKGAFLGGGSCTLPSNSGSKTGYHLEFVFSSAFIAEQFCMLLEDFQLIGKFVERGERWIVYIKSRDLISDFLSLIGAGNALRKLNNLTDERDESNNENRVNNCFVGNTDRTARASAEQVVAIQCIDKKIGISSLDEGLQQLAYARLQFPMESLRTLGEKLNLSKSCLNHRMRKLLEIYSKLEG